MHVNDVRLKDRATGEMRSVRLRGNMRKNASGASDVKLWVAPMWRSSPS